VAQVRRRLTPADREEISRGVVEGLQGKQIAAGKDAGTGSAAHRPRGTVGSTSRLGHRGGVKSNHVRAGAGPFRRGTWMVTP